MTATDYNARSSANAAEGHLTTENIARRADSLLSRQTMCSQEGFLEIVKVLFCFLNIEWEKGINETIKKLFM